MKDFAEALLPQHDVAEALLHNCQCYVGLRGEPNRGEAA